MSVLYVDTSALVPLYAEEVYSGSADRAVKGRIKRVLSSLCVAEFASALRFKQMEKELLLSEAQRIWQLLNEHIKEGFFQRIMVDERDWERAAEFAWSLESRVRTLDAVHLAVVERHNLILVSADKQQIKASHELGIGIKDIRTGL